MTDLRIMPVDMILEQEIIGAILRNNSLYEYISDLTTSEHFAQPTHREIYESIQRLILQGQIITPITLSYLVKFDNLHETLAQMVANVISPTPHGIRTHADKLYDLYLRRRLTNVADQLSVNLYEGKEPALHYLEHTEQTLFELASEKSESNTVSLLNAVKTATDRAETARASGRHITGITTGLIDLDNQLGGLQKSDLIILAGRPSMGKTALGACIALNAARSGHPTAFFSLEMSSDQIGNRLLSQHVKIPSDKLRLGAVNNQDWERIVRAAQDFNEPLYIEDSAFLTIQSLRTKVRRMVRQYKIELVVIDYLQLLSLGKNTENRLQELSAITRTLKAIAKEMQVPILALSQLSRAVEQREDKKPQLADLRESGTIEQDSDVVMFIYREAYYLSRKKPAEGSKEMGPWQDKMAQFANQAEILIAKQRHGPIGTVRLHYEDRWTTFANARSFDG